ncbi:MAG: ABC-type transporter, ATPase subunit [Chlamydiia bacterium]|nr:ABC-type transporter, ATPase subunit [Chlamydiia bacterium]
MTSTPSSSPLPISIQDLSFGYNKGEPTITHATFDVKEGEFIGIIGPNGGGKTTLLKLLMGFLDPWKGSISIFGQSPKKHPNGIAYVPQQLRFDKQFPITTFELVLGGRLSNLPWWGSFSKEDRERALHSLEQVHLSDYAKKPFGTLSGGQAQRALIARALTSNPKILLLDEPTSSVDAQAEADIHELLSKIRKNLTILMVTHDIRSVINHVERVLCVQGRVESMSPAELCEHFALGLYHFPLIQTPQSHLT